MKSIALTLAVLFGALNVVAIAEDTTTTGGNPQEQQKKQLEETSAEEAEGEGDVGHGQYPSK